MSGRGRPAQSLLLPASPWGLGPALEPNIWQREQTWEGRRAEFEVQAKHPSGDVCSAFEHVGSGITGAEDLAPGQ